MNPILGIIDRNRFQSSSGVSGFGRLVARPFINWPSDLAQIAAAVRTASCCAEVVESLPPLQSAFFFAQDSDSFADIRLIPDGDWLRRTHQAKAILVGKRSLGGRFRQVRGRPGIQQIF
ncbi:MAG: hypothetical protein ABI218_16135 [Caldimonas sp.]